MYKSVITGTGSYMPTQIKTNRDFTTHNFYNEDRNRIEADPVEVVSKFKQITGIEERKYASEDLNASDIGAIAAKNAIDDSNIDMETIDQIIVAHNYGNTIKHTIQTDNVPSLASRIKHKLGIQNQRCIPYDVIFGCPGWIQGLIQADIFLKAGYAKKCLVIGTETLSRVLDVYDRDSMLFSDGSGACILEYQDIDSNLGGILSHSSLSHATEEIHYIFNGPSYFPNSDPRLRFIKMNGRKVYEYALKQVPQAMKECMDKTGYQISDLKKIFIHQANEKLDEAIIKAFYKLYNLNTIPEFIMPMSIHTFGNSSVATVPTLFDMVRKAKIQNHELLKNDLVLFASVGAGMNINAVCYQI
ncbi:MAG: ketoacyl-ACP synthase III [Saprospiraceae bacterium]|nr:ketoacyl-ACP synthase III [Saprospiraceae bacterium]MBK9223163.1 ketoacyl-ACP synthase III [Saprospiraceae bacterium]MBK9720692.1 ketoacyl-ACP synthase III [Saprospiraceae bacterium]MBK9727682.1 ketoacyl-ACP synthase III [Saprospiraceae bacterium]